VAGFLVGFHWPDALQHIHIAHAVAPVAARHLSSSLGSSATIASVVIMRPAIEAAF
jgi:hypothetical protein